MPSSATRGPLHDGIGRRDPSRPWSRAGWENFKAQPLLHRSVEDTHLWPRVRRAATGRPAGLALLDEMEAEHAQIDRCSPWSTEIAASLHLSLPPSRRTSAASWPS